MSVQQTPLATGHLLGGTFVVVYPSATYSGSVGGVSETAFWEVLLLPSVSRQCPVPLTTSSGATILTLTPAGSRMTGEATLVECEGRTTWAAEFTRR